MEARAYRSHWVARTQNGPAVNLLILRRKMQRAIRNKHGSLRSADGTHGRVATPADHGGPGEAAGGLCASSI